MTALHSADRSKADKAVDITTTLRDLQVPLEYSKHLKSGRGTCAANHTPEYSKTHIHTLKPWQPLQQNESFSRVDLGRLVDMRFPICSHKGTK